MTSPTKAAPREKEVKFSPIPYRVLETSFINGSLRAPSTDEPVFLPEGVKAGSNLERMDGKVDTDESAKAGAGNEFLDRAIPAIVEDLPAATPEELTAFLAAEQAKGDKARKGVTEAIEKEIEARKV